MVVVKVKAFVVGTPSYCSFFEQWICKFLVSKSQCFRNKIVTLFESIHRFNYMYMYCLHVLLLDQCCRSAKHVLYFGGTG